MTKRVLGPWRKRFHGLARSVRRCRWPKRFRTGAEPGVAASGPGRVVASPQSWAFAMTDMESNPERSDRRTETEPAEAPHAPSTHAVSPRIDDRTMRILLEPNIRLYGP